MSNDTVITITVGKSKKVGIQKTRGPSYGPIWGGAFGLPSRPNGLQKTSAQKSFRPTKSKRQAFPQLKTSQAVKGGIAFGRKAAPQVKWAASTAIRGGRAVAGFIRSRSKPKNIYGKNARAQYIKYRQSAPNKRVNGE